MSIKFNAAIVAGVAAIVAAPAFAQSATIYGGGATLPAIAYVGSSFVTNGNRLSSPGDAGSLLPTYTAKAFGAAKAEVSYCQTGSGLGRRALIGTQAGGTTQNPADGTCGSFVPAVSPVGFGAPAGQKAPDFAASDAPLSQAEYTTFLSGPYAATKKAPVQIPAIAGSVALSYNNTDVSSLNLSATQICGIFNGTITNWNQLANVPAKALKVIYRSDGSGTTFSFSNFMTKNCSGTGLRTGDTFAANVFPAGQSLPATFIGANGNSLVQNAVSTTDGAIGYGEVADAKARLPKLKIATVAGKDPVNDLVAPTLTLLNDTVLTGIDGNGRPTKAPVMGAPTDRAGKNCLVLADPDSYATASGYPIVAVSYLFAYETGNRNAKAVTKLLQAPYTFGVKRATTTVGPGTGFVFLTKSLSTTVSRCVN